MTSCNKARRGSRIYKQYLEDWHGMEEIGFGLTGMAWNRGSRVWPDWNSLERTKSVLARLEHLGIESVGFSLEGLGEKEVGFGLTEIALNEGS
jgi:translation elongation factor EF-1beta